LSRESFGGGYPNPKGIVPTAAVGLGSDPPEVIRDGQLESPILAIL
jgi:hypothetical protein